MFLVKLLAVGHWLTLLAGCFAKRSGCVAYKAFASVTSGYMGGGIACNLYRLYKTYRLHT